MGKREQTFKILIVFAAALILAPVYFFVDARYSSFFPHCPFFTMTGFLCPGCGSQRGISALLHGDILQAIRYNVLLVASLPLVIYSAIVSIINIFRTKPLIQKIFYSPVFVKIVFAVIVLFWLIRNIPAYPFTMLSA